MSFAEMFFGLGPMEIALVVVLGVLLFGRKLPDIGRYLGRSVTDFPKLRDGQLGNDTPRDDDDDPGAAGVPARLKPKPPRLDGKAR